MAERQNTLYVVGINDYYQFGFGHKDKVSQLTKWSPINVETVDTSASGLLVTDSDGNLYSMGNGHQGECAVPTKGYIAKPSRIPFFNDKNLIVSKIFANTNSWTVFWLTDEGEIYGNGRNDNRQLGLDHQQDRFLPTEIPSLKNIIKIASAAKYSLALDTNGTVYRCGNVTDSSSRSGWKRVESLRRIVDIAVGDDHSLFLSEDGTIYGRGRGDAIMKRLLGYSIMGVSDILSPIPFFRTHKIFIKKIACGRQHNLCVDNHGQVWSWGDNSSGQCGDQQCVFYSPREVTGLKGETCVDIKCGADHSYVRTAKEEHFLFGSNAYNECTLIDQETDAISIPHAINHTVKQLTHAQIEDVVLGINSTMIVVSQTPFAVDDEDVIRDMQNEKLLQTISALESQIWQQKEEMATLREELKSSERKCLAYVKKTATEQVRAALASELKIIQQTKQDALQQEKTLVKQMEADENKSPAVAQKDAAADADVDPVNEAAHLLKKWRLEQYVTILIEEMGYDWVEDWKNLTMDDLMGELQFKKGHAQRFMKQTTLYFKKK